MAQQEEIVIKTRSGNHDYNPSKGGKLLNAKDMAMFAGISDMAFSKSWIKDGCPYIPNPKNPKVKMYASAAVMKWRLDKDLKAHDQKIIGEVSSTRGQMTATEADTRKKTAEALLAELKLARELELVANIADLMGNFANAVGHVTATLLGWTANLTGVLTMKDEAEVEKIIKEEVGRILGSLKEYKHDYQGVDEEEL